MYKFYCRALMDSVQFLSINLRFSPHFSPRNPGRAWTKCFLFWPSPFRVMARIPGEISRKICSNLRATHWRYMCLGRCRSGESPLMSLETSRHFELVGIETCLPEQHWCRSSKSRYQLPKTKCLRTCR